MEEDIAEKSGSAAILLWCGALLSAIFSALTCYGRMQGWLLLLLSLFFLATLFGAIYEAKRPKVVIRKMGEKLSYYTWWRRKSIAVTEILKVNFRENKSGCLRLHCGTLIIFAKSKTVRIYNVKNVKNAAMKLWKEIYAKSRTEHTQNITNRNFATKRPFGESSTERAFLCVEESFSEDLAGFCDDDKCVRVDLLDLFA